MNKLLGIKVAEGLLQNAQFTKIEGMISEKRFDKAALRLILNQMSDRLDFQKLTSNYEFNEVFENWEDYVNSEMATYLERVRISSCAIGWLQDFPSNSEELMLLFNRVENKNVAFKYIVYRQRSVVLKQELREKYCSCYDAIIKIIEEVKGFNREDAVEHYFEWGFYVNLDIIKSAVAEFGVEKVQGMLKFRLETKEQYPSAGHFIDMLDIAEFFSSLRNLDIIKPQLYVSVNCLNWDLYAPQNIINALFDNAKVIYERYVREDVRKDMPLLSTVTTPTRGSNRGGYSCVYLFEKDKELLNEAFEMSCKRAGIESAAKEVNFLLERGFSIKITDKMSDLSIIGARHFGEVLLNKPVRNAEELIRLAKRINPFEDEIRPNFSLSAKEHIDIEQFSDEDLNKIRLIFDFDYITHFFDGAVPSYKFLMRVEDKISRLRDIGAKAIDIYSADELLSVLDKFENRIDPYVSRHLKEDLIKKQGSNIDVEGMAKLVSGMSIVPFLRGSEAKGVKLDLQSILTYL